MEKGKTFDKEIEIPGGVDVKVEGDKIVVRGEKGSGEKVLRDVRIRVEKKDKVVLVRCREGLKAGKRDKMVINTFRAHVVNLFRGVKEGYTGMMKICSGHFPMAVSVEGGNVLIKNFLGERVPRKTGIMEGVDVKVEGDKIVVSGVDKEKVGQTMARIEEATRIRGRDRRIFMDGIWIVTKPGKGE